MHSTAALIGTFLYNPEQELVFKTWFSRNQAILEESTPVDKVRIQILLKALGPKEYARLLSPLSPEPPELKSYPEIVEILRNTFGPTKSIFRRKHEILSQQGPPSAHSLPEEIADWANLKGDQFEWSAMTREMFKIFLAVNYAAGPTFKNLRSVMLKAAEEKQGLTMAEREMLVNNVSRLRDAELEVTALKAEVAPTVSKVQQRPPYNRKPKPVLSKGNAQGSSEKRTSNCVGCGEPHARKECRFLQSEFHFCHKTGQVKKMCCAFRCSGAPTEAACSGGTLKAAQGSRNCPPKPRSRPARVLPYPQPRYPRSTEGSRHSRKFERSCGPEEWGQRYPNVYKGGLGLCSKISVKLELKEDYSFVSRDTTYHMLDSHGRKVGTRVS